MRGVFKFVGGEIITDLIGTLRIPNNIYISKAKRLQTFNDLISIQ